MRRLIGVALFLLPGAAVAQAVQPGTEPGRSHRPP